MSMSSQGLSLEAGTVVADIGTCSTRIGFAGEDVPRGHFSTAVGVSVSGEGENSADSANSNSSNLHYDTDNYRENMQIAHPLQDGVIADWDQYESLWTHSLSNLNVDITNSPVVIAEKSYQSSSDRAKLCELMFEKFDAPAVFLSKDAVLACYSCGRTSALVIDCGGSGTTLSPVFDGWVESKGISRSVVGGRYMDAHALGLLRNLASVSASNGIGIGNTLPLFRLDKNSRSPLSNPLKNVHASYEAYQQLEMARHMKESISLSRACGSGGGGSVKGLATDIGSGSISSFEPVSTQYELPDGTVVDVGIDRYACAELLFDPSSLDLQSQEMLDLGLSHVREGALPASTEGISTLVQESISRCEREVQNACAPNIIITGGCSAMDGLPDRIKTEVESMFRTTLPHFSVKAIAAPAIERSICPWLGGSILGSLGAFRDIYMSKAEWKEHGAALLDKKCP